MSSSSAGSGSSSTTIAMLLIASRNRRGIDASASATSFSNGSRRTAGSSIDDRVEVVALGLDRTGLAQRLRTTDPAPVKNQRIGRPRPARLGHRRAQLLLDNDGVVAFRDPDAIRDAEHVSINREPGHTESVAKHYVRGLPPDARQLDKGLHIS